MIGVVEACLRPRRCTAFVHGGLASLLRLKSWILCALESMVYRRAC